MADDTRRSIQIERIALGHYRVSNVRGGSIEVGSGSEHDFTAVELLLAAIGCCTGTDVDHITSRRSPPHHFTITISGDKVRDPDTGNHMENLEVAFDVAFPDGAEGDAARQVLPQAAQRSHQRLCTVSRTVQAATPIATMVNGTEIGD